MRILIILLILPLLVLAESPDSNPHTQEAGEHRSSKASKENNYADALTPLIEQLEAIERNVRPDSAGNQANQQYNKDTIFIAGQDLGQQTRMADYALVAVLVSSTGVALLIFTLIYTKSAAQSTEKTLQIAREQLRQNRAYLTIGKCETANNFSGNEFDGFIVTMELVNSGGSPALNVWCATKFNAPLVSDSIPDFSCLEADFRSTGIVGKGAITHSWIKIEKNIVRECVEKNRRFFCHMTVKYRDVYKKQYFANFTYEIVFNLDPSFLDLSAEQLKGRSWHAIFANAVGPQNGETEITGETE